MAQMEPDSERTEDSSSSTPIAAELAAIAKKRVEECIDAQTELLGRLQERNRQWLDRLQQEANLASEFASKLTAARSIPDAMTACQEWTSWWFEMMAEDGKHLLADTEQFMETGARLMSNGSSSSRIGIST